MHQQQSVEQQVSYTYSQGASKKLKEDQSNLQNIFDSLSTSFGIPRAKSQDKVQGQDNITKLRRKLTSYQSEKQINTPINSSQFIQDEHIRVTLSRNFLSSPSKYEEHYSALPRRRSFRYSDRGLSLVQESHQFLQQIQFTRFQRWFLLIITVILNSIVPCWMTVDIKSEGMTRNGWRFFTMSVLMIPFVMSQQRSVYVEQQKLKSLLKFKNLKRIYLCSFNHCIWVLIGVMATKLTAGSHSFCFLRLKFFVLSLVKLYKKEMCHEGQIGGSLLVTIGILMMFWDSLSIPMTEHPTLSYLKNEGWKRFLGDIFAILGCLVLFKLESKYQLPKGPRFTMVCLYNMCISINLMLFAFLMGLNQFSFNPKNGIFGLFTSNNFVSIFYVSIILGLNLIIANVLVNQIFSVFIRNIASSFQIVVTTSIFHIFAIQQSYSGLTNLGLCFLVPGMMMIIGGQGSLQKLQFKINEKIYTCDSVGMGSDKQIMQVVLKHILAATGDSPKKSSLIDLKTVNEQSNQEQSSLHAKPKSE